MADTSSNVDSGNDSQNKGDEGPQTPKRKCLSPVSKSITYVRNELGKFGMDILDVISIDDQQKKIKALKRITMVIDIAQDTLKNTCRLLDATIENISRANPQLTQNQVDDAPNLTQARISKPNTVPSPITESICKLDLILGTFLATCWSEIIKHFETKDNVKLDKLRQLKKFAEISLRALKQNRGTLEDEKKGIQHDFTDLPTKRVIFCSDEELQIIEIMRKCEIAKQKVVKALKTHANCVAKQCFSPECLH